LVFGWSLACSGGEKKIQTGNDAEKTEKGEVAPSEEQTSTINQDRSGQDHSNPPKNTDSDHPSCPNVADKPDPAENAQETICRQYATQSLSQFDGDPEDTAQKSCVFEAGTNILTCELAGDAVFNATTITTYQSVRAFVLEGQTVGSIGWLTRVNQEPSGTVNYTESLEFDDQGKATSLTTTRGGETSPYWTETYTAWDSEHRPTQGLMQFEGRYGRCTNWEVSIEYQQPEGRVTREVFGGSGDGCYDETVTRTYDAQGHLLKEVTTSDGEDYVEAITITAHEEICSQ